MKVFNVCFWDHANFAYDNMMALRSVGVDCNGMKVEPHAFDYSQQLPCSSSGDIREKASECDVIQIFHSSTKMLNALKHLGKRMIVYHCSSDYRMKPSAMNAAFNPYVERSVLCLGEFWGLGAKNQIYMVGAIDCSNNVPITTNSELVFAHYPSNEQVKGTGDIVSACAEAGVLFRTSTKKRSHKLQQLSMSRCDVYIELLKSDLYGRPYGSFGITALEAASMGKIVVTQCLTKDVYEHHYGRLPFVLVENYADLVSKLNWLKSLPLSDITRMKQSTRKWVVDNHSYEATGKYLIDNVL